ncbi:MAG: hypothetical protein CME72_11545 [Halomonadaceae bacterium]|nr:hypothetical protein [Halomonadaceae bacterium]
MTHFRVRPKRPWPHELQAAYKGRIQWIRNSRYWLMGSELRGVERRDVVPLIDTLAAKAKQCVEYDRKCARIAKARS